MLYCNTIEENHEMLKFETAKRKAPFVINIYACSHPIFYHLVSSGLEDKLRAQVKQTYIML